MHQTNREESRHGNIPLRDIFSDLHAPAKAHIKAENKKQWTPEYARFKLQFIWRSGGTSIPYHSYDIHRTVGAKNVTDERVGYAKLIALIDKNRDKYVVATIFANLTDDLRTYIDGKLNKNYDHIVLKHVRGHKNPTVAPMEFNDKGQLDVIKLRRGVAQ